MPDMRPEDLEKLRKLEEEVDREREEARKRREEIEKRALVPLETQKAETLPAKKEEESKAVATEADSAEWKRGMQKKIAIGAGAGMLVFWVASNLMTILAAGVVVGGAWYFSGKYLGADPDTKKKSDEKDA
jgi:hypothetical protein